MAGRETTSDVLFDILRCPLHPESGRMLLLQKAGTASLGGIEAVQCPVCRRTYPIVDGIPDMVVEGGFESCYLAAESDQWDQKTEEYEGRRERNAVYMAGVRAIVGGLGGAAGEMILDAACGTGLVGKRILMSADRLIALDLSMMSLRYFRKTVGDGAMLHAVRGNLSALPFRPGVFDKVVCANALHHLPNSGLRARSVDELARVARHGARVVVAVNNYSVRARRSGLLKEGPYGEHFGQAQYIYRFESAEFRSLLSARLQIEHVLGAALPLWYRWKLSPIMRLLELRLPRLPVSRRYSFMLVGICRCP
jgi:SAM-dependent methyltransferase